MLKNPAASLFNSNQNSVINRAFTDRLQYYILAHVPSFSISIVISVYSRSRGEYIIRSAFDGLHGGGMYPPRIFRGAGGSPVRWGTLAPFSTESRVTRSAPPGQRCDRGGRPPTWRRGRIADRRLDGGNVSLPPINGTRI